MWIIAFSGTIRKSAKMHESLILFVRSRPRSGFVDVFNLPVDGRLAGSFQKMVHF